jgi:hypothetical protein
VSVLAPLTSSTAAAPAPVVDQPLAPASARSGPASARSASAAAQGFEEMLLQQLSSSLVQSSGLEGGAGTEAAGEEGPLATEGEAGGGMLTALLPQTLAESVARGGGLGVARQLAGSPGGAAHAGTVGPTGGAGA